MKCAYPGFYSKKFVFFPCGQCLACRINRKRVWTMRMMFELERHQNASFITLTYNNENLPLTFQGLGTLSRSHPPLFMKRLREDLRQYGIFIRFYGCAEYGDRTFRPHYHYIIYGVDFRVPFFKALLQKHWRYGFIDVGKDGVNRDCIQYVAGYITKKMTSNKDERLLGRYPEFCMLSKGIGVNAVDYVIANMEVFNKKLIPNTVKFALGEYAIGRYLKNKVKLRLDDIGFKYEEDVDFQNRNHDLAVFCYKNLDDKFTADMVLQSDVSFKLMKWFASPLIDHAALERIKKLYKFNRNKRNKL